MIYEYLPDSNNFDCYDFQEKIDVTSLFFSDGSIINRWNIPKLNLLELEESQKSGDFPTLVRFYDIPIFSAKAWGALGDFLSPASEALPVSTDGGVIYYLIHIKETTDALNLSRSDYSINEVSGSINRVFKYCFYDELINGKIIFKLPRSSGGGLFINHRFRELVEINGLVGLNWSPVSMV